MDQVNLNLQEIGLKAKSKAEIYRILTVEGELYLPPQKETNMQFISDIIVGDKKALCSKSIYVCRVPYIQDLRSEDLIKFILNEVKAEEYLPSNYMEHIPNREWLCNLCNSLDKTKFQAMIKEILGKREAKIIKAKYLHVGVKPEIAKIFADSQMVSVSKGRSNFLLRKNLNKKNKDLRDRERAQEQELLGQIPKLKQKIEELKEEIDEKNHELDKRMEDSDILKKLYNDGIIDLDGNPVINE